MLFYVFIFLSIRVLNEPPGMDLSQKNALLHLDDLAMMWIWFSIVESLDYQKNMNSILDWWDR